MINSISRTIGFTVPRRISRKELGHISGWRKLEENGIKNIDISSRKAVTCRKCDE